MLRAFLLKISCRRWKREPGKPSRSYLSLTELCRPWDNSVAYPVPGSPFYIQEYSDWVLPFFLLLFDEHRPSRVVSQETLLFFSVRFESPREISVTGKNLSLQGQIPPHSEQPMVLSGDTFSVWLSRSSTARAFSRVILYWSVVVSPPLVHCPPARSV